MAYLIAFRDLKEGAGHVADRIIDRARDQGILVGESRIEGSKIEIRRVRKLMRLTRHRSLTQSEWADFNELVNDVLDALGLSADITSTPFDHSGKLVIRKGFERCATL